MEGRRRAAAAASIVAAALAAVACAEGPPRAAVPHTPEPRRGGTLHLLQQAPESLDPVESTSVYESVPVNQIFDSLVDLAPDLSVRPGLATAWTISSGGRTYDFELRSGVRFHDGTPLTAADVTFSIERAAKSDYASSLALIEGADAFVSGARDRLSGVEALGEHRIRIRLAHPSVSFLETLAMDGLKIVPRSAVLAAGEEAFGRRPVGTGPFRFAGWDDDRLALEAHLDYFRGAPYLDRLELGFLRGDDDGDDIVEAWFDGPLGVVDVPLPEMRRFESDPDTRILRFPQLSVAFLGLSVGTAPLDDPHLRRAVAHAIDREGIAAESRATRLPATSVLPPGLHGYSPDFKGPGYDPAAARRQLAAAGAPTGDDGAAIPLYHSGASEAARRVVERIGRDLSAVGIRVEPRRVSWSELNRRIEDHAPGMFLLAWVADQTDPDAFLRSLFHSRSSSNFFGWADPETDALLDLGARESSPEIRSDLYRKLENRILDGVPMVPLFHSVACVAVKRDVHGLEPSPMGMAAVAFENVWIASEGPS